MFCSKEMEKKCECIMSIKTNQDQQEGKALFNGAELASDEDVESLPTVCLLEGTQKGASFFVFNKLTYHLIAQSC